MQAYLLPGREGPQLETHLNIQLPYRTVPYRKPISPICPPEWQRVPTQSKNKKRKLSQSLSPERIQTSNRFSNLPVDLTEKDEETKQKKCKPPPIVLYGVEDVGKLTDLLMTVADKDQFTFKIVNRNQMGISCFETEVYKKLITIVRETGLIDHTFNRKDQKNYRIVIRNLHHSTPIDAIVEAIESTGNSVVGEIVNAKYGPEKTPTSTFFANLLHRTNNKTVKDLRYIYHQSVRIEDPRKRNSIVQCQRCQYGHSKNYCMRPYRCVKCALPHKILDCPKRDRSTPAECALCHGAHPANYKGCKVYQEIRKRKTAPLFLKKQEHRASQPAYSTSNAPITTNVPISNTLQNKKENNAWANGPPIWHPKNDKYP